MRAIAAAALCSGLLSGAAAAQGHLGPPAPRPVADSLLVRLLNGATQRHVEGLSEDEVPPIFLRLYAAPEAGSCVPGTRETCGHRYYLALGDNHEPPRQSVFELGLLGEVTRAELLTDDGGPPARLRLTVANHPSWVLERRPELRRPPAVYTLLLDVDSLRVTRSGAAAAQPDPLRPRRIANPLLVRLLNDADALDIDGIDDGGEPPPIMPRLYDVHEDVSCPGMQERFACAARYYLALDVGAGPGRRARQVVFDLGLLGEITNADLLRTTGGEPPRLRLRVLNYASWVFDGQNPPARREAVYTVVLGAGSLRITRER